MLTNPSPPILPPDFANLKRPKVSGSPVASALALLVGIPMVCCLVLFLLFFAKTLFESQIRTQRLNNEGVVVRGVVTDLKISSPEDSPSYNVSYRFTAPRDGEMITFEDQAPISQELYRRLELGGGVDITYARSDPTISSVEAELQPIPFLAAALMVVIPLSILAIGAWFVVRSLLALKRFIRIRSDGQATKGMIIEEWEGRDQEGSTCYYVAYAFRDRTGEVFSNAEQSSMAYHKLKVGDTVNIRYLPDNPKIAKLADYHL